jgi:hypothetical protein
VSVSSSFFDLIKDDLDKGKDVMISGFSKSTVTGHGRPARRRRAGSLSAAACHSAEGVKPM